MAKDFVRSKDNVKNITTEKIDHTEVNDLLHDGENSYIHTPKHKFHNLLDNIKNIIITGTESVLGRKSGNDLTLDFSSLENRLEMLENSSGGSFNNITKVFSHLIPHHQQVYRGTFITKENSFPIQIDYSEIGGMYVSSPEIVNYVGSIELSFIGKPPFSIPFTMVNASIRHNAYHDENISIHFGNERMVIFVKESYQNIEATINLDGFIINEQRGLFPADENIPN